MTIVFLLYHTWLLAQFFPWKPLTAMPPSTDASRTCFSRLSALHQPTVLMWGIPLGCLPKSSVSLFRLLGEPFAPWSNLQILDSPASLEGDVIMWSSCSQAEVCWRIRGNILLPSVKSTWLEAVFPTCAWALGVGGCVPRCRSRCCNQGNGWEVSPESEVLSCWGCRDYPGFLLSQANQPFWT